MIDARIEHWRKFCKESDEQVKNFKDEKAARFAVEKEKQDGTMTITISGSSLSATLARAGSRKALLKPQ